MSLPDELQSLAALKAKGALTEQEFAQAKAAVIAKYGGTSTATPVATAAQHKQGAPSKPLVWPGQPMFRQGHSYPYNVPEGYCPGCLQLIGQGDNRPAGPVPGWCNACYGC